MEVDRSDLVGGYVGQTAQKTKSRQRSAMVLLRDPSLTPEEILMSESQERMMAIVAPESSRHSSPSPTSGGLETSVLGEVTGDGRLTIDWYGERIVDVDPSTVAVDGPVYNRPVAYPSWIDAMQADTAEALPRTDDPAVLREQFASCRVEPEPGRQVVGHGTTTTTWVATPRSCPDDSGMVCRRRTGPASPSPPTRMRGSASSTRMPAPSWPWPRRYRNVAVSGAVPAAVTDCLNFGVSEDPEVMWQFPRGAWRALGCLPALET